MLCVVTSGFIGSYFFDPGESRTEIGSGSVKVFFKKLFQQCVLDFFFWDQRLNNSIFVLQYAFLLQSADNCIGGRF